MQKITSQELHAVGLRLKDSVSLNDAFSVEQHEGARRVLHQLVQAFQERAHQLLPRIVSGSIRTWTEVHMDGQRYVIDPPFHAGLLPSSDASVMSLYENGLPTAKTLAAESVEDSSMNGLLWRIIRDVVLDSGTLLREWAITPSFATKMQEIAVMWQQQVCASAKIFDAKKGADVPSLAGRMIRHDLANYMTPLGMASMLAEMSPGVEHSVRSALVNSRIVAASMGLLHLGNEAGGFLRLPVNEEDGLCALQSQKVQELRLQPTTTDTLFIAQQWIKNAAYAGGSDIRVCLEAGEDHECLTVADNARGIVDAQGNPVSPQELHTIFGDFSTKKGGGLGLQLVKALVEMRGGVLSVASKTATHPVQAFSQNPDILPVPERTEKGTTFQVLMPKEGRALQEAPLDIRLRRIEERFVRDFDAMMDRVFDIRRIQQPSKKD